MALPVMPPERPPRRCVRDNCGSGIAQIALVLGAVRVAVSEGAASPPPNPPPLAVHGRRYNQLASAVVDAPAPDPLWTPVRFG